MLYTNHLSDWQKNEKNSCTCNYNILTLFVKCGRRRNNIAEHITLFYEQVRMVSTSDNIFGGLRIK
jgi:hypothetical protein